MLFNTINIYTDTFSFTYHTNVIFISFYILLFNNTELAFAFSTNTPATTFLFAFL